MSRYGIVQAFYFLDILAEPWGFVSAIGCSAGRSTRSEGNEIWPALWRLSPRLHAHMILGSSCFALSSTYSMYLFIYACNLSVSFNIVIITGVLLKNRRSIVRSDWNKATIDSVGIWADNRCKHGIKCRAMEGVGQGALILVTVVGIWYEHNHTYMRESNPLLKTLIENVRFNHPRWPARLGG